MRLTYPGRSSTTDDPDDPVRRRVLPDGRLDPISINSSKRCRGIRRTWSLLPGWNCSLSMNLRSLVSKIRTRGSSRSFAKRFFSLSFFLSLSFSSPSPLERVVYEECTPRKISTFSSPLSRTLARSSVVASTRERDLSFLFSSLFFSPVWVPLSLSLSLRACV